MAGYLVDRCAEGVGGRLVGLTSTSQRLACPSPLGSASLPAGSYQAGEGLDDVDGGGAERDELGTAFEVVELIHRFSRATVTTDAHRQPRPCAWTITLATMQNSTLLIQKIALGSITCQLDFIRHCIVE